MSCLSSALVPLMLPHYKGLMCVCCLSPAGLRKSLVMKHALPDTTFATQVFFEHCPQGTATLLLFPTSQTLNLSFPPLLPFLLFLPTLSPGFLSP